MVEVIVRVEESEEVPEGERRTLYERLKPFIGIANDLPPDASEQHDHYLYGTRR